MGKRKNIAFVANTSWSIYNFRLEVMQHLRDEGHAIFVIAPRDKHSEKLIAEGFTFIEAPIKAYSNNPIHDLQYLLFLKRTYQKLQFDHIFHYTIKSNIYGSIAAKWTGIKSTAVVTGLGRVLNMPKGFSKSLLKQLYSWGAGCADDIWFLNEKDRRYFINNHIAPNVYKSILPSEGVNLNKYAISKEKDFSSISFLFAGRLIGEKGVHLFIKAAKQLKEYHPYINFNIVGFINPSDSDSISQQELLSAQSQGLITYHGDTEDIRPYIEEASCVVLPSTYGEGISRTLLEAAAMSTPIITTDNRGCSEVLVDGYNGFLAKKGDLESLVDQLRAFISLDENAKKRMGENGRDLVSERFSILKVLDQYVSALSKSEGPTHVYKQTL